MISVGQLVAISTWLFLAWWTRLDRVFIIFSVLLGIYFNLGSRRPGSYSAYNIFNKGFKHLLGDLRGDQIDAELRNKIVGRDNAERVNEGTQDEDEPEGGIFSSKNANKLCACGSKKKTKKCCGAVSSAEREERQRLRRVEIDLEAKREKYQFL